MIKHCSWHHIDTNEIFRKAQSRSDDNPWPNLPDSGVDELSAEAIFGNSVKRSLALTWYKLQRLSSAQIMTFDNIWTASCQGSWERLSESTNLLRKENSPVTTDLYPDTMLTGHSPVYRSILEFLVCIWFRLQVLETLDGSIYQADQPPTRSTSDG